MKPSFMLPCIVAVLLLVASAAVAFGAEWSGIDETVVEKYAAAHGRKASEPLINTDQGDLLLFVFLLAGTAGGFAAGYYWKALITGRGVEKRTTI